MNSKKPAHQRFLDGKAEKKRKRQLKLKNQRQEKSKEQYKVRRYLFKQWLRQQFRKKKIPWDFYRRYSINHQCYLWMIERAAGILCGDHPGRWNYACRDHERIFRYMRRDYYDMEKCQEAPSSDLELQEALKDEVAWMERQDMRQIVVLALWEKYNDLTKLPWADKGRKNIHRTRYYLAWTFREIARQRCYQLKHNVNVVNDAEYLVAQDLEDQVIRLQQIGTASKRARYATFRLLKGYSGTNYAEDTMTYHWTRRELRSILKKSNKENFHARTRVSSKVSNRTYGRRSKGTTTAS